MDITFNANWIPDRATEVFEASCRYLLKAVATYVAVLLRPSPHGPLFSP